MSGQQQPIIIIKKKITGHAHHGGAWKVAYADFVTAMMALFIVLWLLSSSEQVKKAIGGYFADPAGVNKEMGNGLKGTGSESVSIKKAEMKQIKEKLEQAIRSSKSLAQIKEHIIITITQEGLRVEMLETENGVFFESASAAPTGLGKDLLASLAAEVGKLPNTVTVEGHTDSRAFSGDNGYTNWELSTDRANAARRWMQENGIRHDQVKQVRGFADQSLRDKDHPDDATNRRVTVIIHYEDDDGKPTTAPPLAHSEPAREPAK